MNEDKKCCECMYCVKESDFWYCLMKDLYTSVYKDSVCDEINFRGEYYFCKEEK